MKIPVVVAGLALLCSLSLRAAESALPALPSVTNVDWQPLSAQIKRVVEAMEYQGGPLPADEKRALEAISADTPDAVSLLQAILDRHCLFAVTINPEMR